MKVLIDMNLSPKWVDILSNAGFKAFHWSTIGEADAPDTRITQHAAANGFVVPTHDLDFSAMLAASKGEKPSVVQIRVDDIRPQSIGTSVIAALHQMERELLEGALMTIDTKRTRLRLLPLITGDWEVAPVSSSASPQSSL